MPVEMVTMAELDVWREKIQLQLGQIIEGQQEMLQRLDQLAKKSVTAVPVQSGYIPALEYMRRVGIKRWKFDQLIAGNKIRAIKKMRKIYVPVEEVERYFKDPEVR